MEPVKIEDEPEEPGRIPKHLMSMVQSAIEKRIRPPPSSAEEEATPPPSSEEEPARNTNPDDIIKMILPLFRNLSALPREQKTSRPLSSGLLLRLGEGLAPSHHSGDPTLQAYIFLDKLFCCYKIYMSLLADEHQQDASFNLAFGLLDKTICQQFDNALQQLSK